MGYNLAIGYSFNQPFSTGDVVPQYTAIHGEYCHTIIPCVGKAPANLEHDDPAGEISYHAWTNFVAASLGLRRLAQHIILKDSQIIYLAQPEVQEIIRQIKNELPKIRPDSFKDRAEWLVFWSEESLKRYGSNAAIGLF